MNGSSLITSYAFSFAYTLCSVGRGAALQRTNVQESGTITVNVRSQDVPPPTFAGYGAFINNYTPCSGYLVPGTFSGPTFTNGAWELGNSGAYIFTNHVGQANSQIDYWIGGNCNKSTASSYSGINVNFQQGLTLGAPTVPLPPDSYSQAWAAIDGVGCGETTGPTCNGSSNGYPPSALQLSSYLKDVNGNAYPSTGTSSGVFLPYTGSTFGTATSTGSGSYPPAGYGGGIYVQGNASVVLSPSTDTSGNLTQIYTITQGATVTTVTTDPGANTTTISSGGTNQNVDGYPGKPCLQPRLANSRHHALRERNHHRTEGAGPGSAGDSKQCHGHHRRIEQHRHHRRHHLYRRARDAERGRYPYHPGCERIQRQRHQYSRRFYRQWKYPALQLLLQPEPRGGQEAWQPSDRPEQEGCTSSTCGFTVSGSINTFNNVGGQIQSNIFGGNMNTENTYFDQRFTNWTAPGGGGFSPPWFPSITNNGGYTPQQPAIVLSQQRTSWAWAPVQ